MNAIKQVLYDLCAAYITGSITEIEAAITDRREAMHNETKSSMGDKYETTREMLQQDINMNTERLQQARASLSVLQSIDLAISSDIIIPGSVVAATNGNFYISVSVGHFIVEGKKYYAVSISSPIGTQLKGKRAGDSFVLNGKSFNITEVL